MIKLGASNRLNALKKAAKTAWTDVHDRREPIVYAIMWLLIIAAVPSVELYDIHRGFVNSFRTEVVLQGLLGLVPYFILFLFNDLVLSRIIVQHRRVVLYVLTAIAAALTIQFIIGQPSDMWRRNRNFDMRPADDVPPPPDEMMGERPDSIAPPEKMGIRGERPFDWHDNFKNDMRNNDMRNRNKPAEMRRMNPFGPFVGSFAMSLLMMSIGILVKLYLIGERDKKKFSDLEHERTKSELDQLKYQLSPHFMMNTLNNIHALVDIDTERAKQTIEQMSRLMRYMLYESRNATVPLRSEVEFLRNYIELMRIRYTDDVSINVSLPTDTADITLPPLLFVNMVENAFKHGISYATKSFVDVRMSISHERDRVVFCCTNSLGSKPQDGQHGIGLANTRKRLDLLCAGRYEFSAVQLDDRYIASLSLKIDQTN